MQNRTRRLVLTIVFPNRSVIRYLFRMRIHLCINKYYHVLIGRYFF